MNLEKYNPLNWFKRNNSQDSSRQSESKQDQSLAVDHGSALSTQNSYASFLDFHREIDHFFDEVFSNFRTGIRPSLLNDHFFSRVWPEFQSFSLSPRLSHATEDNRHVLSLEVPGLDEGDISISLDGNTLHIQAEKNEQVQSSQEGYVQYRKQFRRFNKRINLPYDAQIEDITADINNGVLNISVPRKALASGKNIPISRS